MPQQKINVATKRDSINTKTTNAEQLMPKESQGTLVRVLRFAGSAPLVGQRPNIT
jgi:hypothetical protein